MSNLNTNLSLDAGRQALSLRWDYSDLDEIIKWADAEIMYREEISDNLFSLSLAKSTNRALTLLNRMSEGADEWEVLGLFLRGVPDTITFEKASQLARHLYYYLVQGSNVPEIFGVFWSYDSDFHLVEEQISHFTKSELLASFLEDIQYAARGEMKPKKKVSILNSEPPSKAKGQQTPNNLINRIWEALGF